MNFFTIIGFGIPGDEAIVEAETTEHARARLADHLQSACIEFNHTDTWIIEPADRPVLIVKWKE